jgi:hypothetical protein
MKRELTNQELLDRYIHAVKLMLMLPPDKMEDIGAEVRSILESQLDDRATALGRELRPDEVSAVLKQHGHPAKVALRYREQPGQPGHGLISPALFPLYWFTLRAILAVWVTIRVIVAVFVFQGTSPARTILLNLGRDVVLAAIIIPAGITLLFAAWEYLDLRFRLSERWKPETLSPVPPCTPQAAKHRPMVQIISGIAWLILWALALFSPSFFWVWGGRGVFSPSDALYAMRFPVWLTAFSWICLSWLGDTRFAASKWRHLLRIAVVVVGVALAIGLVRSGDLLVAGPKWTPIQAKSLATLNQMIAGVLVLGCIVVGLDLVRRFIRIIRRSSTPPRTADSTS